MKCYLQDRQQKKKTGYPTRSFNGRGFVVNYSNSSFDCDYTLQSIKTSLRRYYHIRAAAYRTGNASLCCLLADLDYGINSLDIKDRDWMVLMDYMNGYNGTEIAKRFDMSRKNSHYIFTEISKSILKTLTENV